MDTPFYKLFLFKPTPRFYDLAEGEFKALRREMNAQQAKLGIRNLFNARMAWSNEQYTYFGVEFYPSLAAVETYTQCLTELGYYRYVDAESYLGIPMDRTYPDFEQEQPAEIKGKTIYRVYLSRETGWSLGIPVEERKQAYARVNEAGERAGIQPLLNAYARWNNEGWEYFGVERFPNIETVIRYTQFLSDSGWYRLVDSRSYLGTAFSGLIAGMAEDVEEG